MKQITETSDPNVNKNELSFELIRNILFLLGIDFSLDEQGVVIYEIQSLLHSVGSKAACNFILKEHYPKHKKIYIQNNGTRNKDQILMYLDYNYSINPKVATNSFKPDDFLEYGNLKTILQDQDALYLLHIDSEREEALNPLYRRMSQTHPNVRWLNPGKSFFSYLLINKALQRLVIEQLAPKLNPDRFIIIDKKEFLNIDLEKLSKSLNTELDEFVIVKNPAATRGEGTWTCRLKDLPELFSTKLKNLPNPESLTPNDYFIIESVSVAKSYKGDNRTHRLAAMIDGNTFETNQCIVWEQTHKEIVSHRDHNTENMDRYYIKKPEKYENSPDLLNFLNQLLQINPLNLIKNLLEKKSTAIKTVCRDTVDYLKTIIFDELSYRLCEEENCDLSDLIPYLQQLKDVDSSISINSKIFKIPNLDKLKSTLYWIDEARRNKVDIKEKLIDSKDSLEFILNCLPILKHFSKLGKIITQQLNYINREDHESKIVNS